MSPSLFMQSASAPSASSSSTLPRLLRVVLTTLFLLASQATWAQWTAFQLGPDQMKVGWKNHRLSVRLPPRSGEGGHALAQRVFREGHRSYKTLKRFHKRPLMVGHDLTLPLELLDGKIRGAALKAFFAKDQSSAEGWEHRVTHSWENLTVLVEYFARAGTSPLKVARHNRLRQNGNLLRRNERVVFPWDWVDPELGLRPASKIQKPLYVKASDPGHVFYRMQSGEAIYSSVVVRFTGRLLHDEVDDLANQLLSLNKIRNPRLVQPRQEIRIPLDWISEEYTSEGSSRPAPKVVVKRPAPRRQKLHVILDAGHGGRDPGAIAGSKSRKDRIHEDEVVYDISLRLIPLLKKRGITVHPTLVDPNQSAPVKRLNPRHDDDEYLLVNPRYTVRNSRTGINMRVYLINHLYQDLRRKGVPDENIVFMSLHGDALHASLSGAMVYFPDHRLRKSRFGLNSSVYRQRKEYVRTIHYSQRENRSAAEASEVFGETVIQSFRSAGLRVHSSKAVRGYLYRRGKKTLPGVLRYSKVPTSVLVEVANLNHSRDRQDLLRDSVRQNMAQALAQALDQHFSGESGIVAQR